MEKKSCCPIGSEPENFTNYTALGKEEKIQDMKIYTNGPKTKNGMIIIHDIYGYEGGRSKLICDQIANLGYKVYMPDFFRGEKKTEEYGLEYLIKKYNWEKNVKNDLFEKTLKKMENDGIEQIGLMGFCWGSYVIWHACNEKYSEINNKFKFGINFHPSLGVFDLLGDGDKIKKTQQLTCPQLIGIAGNDPDYLRENGDIFENLKNSSKFGKDFEFYDYKDMKHGFVSRGDVGREVVRRDVKDAMMKGVKYMKKFFK